MDREEIEGYLAEIPGKTSVYYRNLASGETIGIRENIPMMAASVIKIPILVEAFRQIRTGEHSKSEIYVLQEGDKRPSCGCLNRMHAGLAVTYEDLCNLMIILSDNSATNILIRLLGGMDRINRDLREMGYETLRVNRLLFDREASERGIQNYVSAAEIGDMLEKMYWGELVDREASEDMIDILKEQRLNGKFPFRFRDKIDIAHKTGEDSGITHDVGIFYAREPFILCCLGNETDCPAFNRFMQDIAWKLYEGQKGGKMKAIAAKAVVSLMERPSSRGTLDDELLYGMVVEVVEEAADEEEGENVPWVLVRTPYRYTGYCRKEDFILDEERIETWEHGELCVVMHRFADVLSEPRVQGVCLASVARGGRLLVHREENTEEGWVCVELADGRRGYTKEKFLGEYYDAPFTDDEALFRERLVEMAKGYLGTQYRWGGKSSLGIDCSGLTSMCYMLCGVYIYRNAGFVEDFSVHEIPIEEKKPGDLLYFPGHIAMYIGDDRYIHSTGKNGSDGVVINSLNPDHEDFRKDLLEMLERAGSIFG